MSAAVEHLLNYLHGGWPSTKKHAALRSEIEKVRMDALLEAAEIVCKKSDVGLVCNDLWMARQAIVERSREI